MNWRFHPKVTAGIFASYVSVVAIYAAAAYGYHIDGILGSAVDGILTTVFAYFMPSDDTVLTAENLQAILARFPSNPQPGEYHAPLPPDPVPLPPRLMPGPG
jgi:hypothetical protein